MPPLTRSNKTKNIRPRRKPKIHLSVDAKTERPRKHLSLDAKTGRPRKHLSVDSKTIRPRGRPRKHLSVDETQRAQLLKSLNNEASKRSREKKRIANQELQKILSNLQKENKKLKFELERLTNAMKFFQMKKCNYCDQDPQAQFLVLFRLQRVTKVLNSQKQIWRPWSS